MTYKKNKMITKNEYFMTIGEKRKNRNNMNIYIKISVKKSIVDIV